MGLFTKNNNHFHYVAPLGPEMSFVSTEAFNTIRTNLRFSKNNDNSGQVIAISSSTPNDGKSYVAINTAYSLAKSGLKVLLMDCDLRKPTIAKKIGMKNVSGGVTELIIGMAEFKDVVVKNLFNESLDLLMSGTIPPNPSDLLASNEMRDIFNFLKTIYDYIIVDMPPVESVADTVSLAEKLDGVVIVVRHNLTRRSTLRDTLKQLNFAGIKILGFVYNGYEKESMYYHNSYSYRYYYKNYR